MMLLFLGVAGTLRGQNQRVGLRPAPAPPETLAAAAEQFFRSTFRPRFGAVEVAGIPGSPHRLLVSGSVREPEGYEALRLFLLEESQGGFLVLSRTAHQEDADWFTPVVFAGEGNLLILADVGSEYSWGLRAFVIRGDTIEALPPPLVAAPDYESELGPAKSALPNVAVFSTGHGFELEFDTALVLNPGRRDRALLCRSAPKIVLVQQPSDWRIVGAHRVLTDIRAPLPHCGH
jgi:hypothetical protein